MRKQRPLRSSAMPRTSSTLGMEPRRSPRLPLPPTTLQTSTSPLALHSTARSLPFSMATLDAPRSSGSPTLGMTQPLSQAPACLGSRCKPFLSLRHMTSAPSAQWRSGWRMQRATVYPWTASRSSAHRCLAQLPSSSGARQSLPPAQSRLRGSGPAPTMSSPSIPLMFEE